MTKLTKEIVEMIGAASAREAAGRLEAAAEFYARVADELLSSAKDIRDNACFGAIQDRNAVFGALERAAEYMDSGNHHRLNLAKSAAKFAEFRGAMMVLGSEEK